MRFPTIKEVSEHLKDLDVHVFADDPDVGETNDDGERFVDVRLQVLDGSWDLFMGDPSYDTDHRGVWGCGSIRLGATKKECRELAFELIEGAKDHAAEMAAGTYVTEVERGNFSFLL